MSFFSDLLGFNEVSFSHTKETLVIGRISRTIRSKVNGRSIRYGRFHAPSLSCLREALPSPGGRLSFSEVSADVSDLHRDPNNEGAMFQVASQFNCLEMASPSLTRQFGIEIYEQDKTQGPACSIACAGGTLYRNYFAENIDLLNDLWTEWGPWTNQNGYVFPSRSCLLHVKALMRAVDDGRRNELMGLVRVGVQGDTEVTLPDCGHLVNQVFCSALPIAYSPDRFPLDLWEGFARFILDAQYEGAFLAALIHGSRDLFLTRVGGGVFGNPVGWIDQSIDRACRMFAGYDLRVRLVNFPRG